MMFLNYINMVGRQLAIRLKNLFNPCPNWDPGGLFCIQRSQAEG